MSKPIYDITVQQAAERAHQAEIICRLMEDHPHHFEDCDVSAIATLLKRLTGDVAAFLIAKSAEEESHNAQPN